MSTKLETLEDNLKSLESVLIAFSGGVDSTFLLKVAHGLLQAVPAMQKIKKAAAA